MCDEGRGVDWELPGGWPGALGALVWTEGLRVFSGVRCVNELSPRGSWEAGLPRRSEELASPQGGALLFEVPALVSPGWARAPTHGLKEPPCLHRGFL